MRRSEDHHDHDPERRAARPSADLDAISRALSKPRLPPVHQWNPEVCGEIDMRIARNGTWHYQGTPISRQRMVQLFSTVLRREGDRYFLVTPVEKLQILVEDAPFSAVAMTVHGEGRGQALVFRTNVEEEVMAGPDHPIRVETDPGTEEPSPYVLVRDGMDALINRPAFYDLVEIAVEERVEGRKRLGVWSAGSFFPLDSGRPG